MVGAAGHSGKSIIPSVRAAHVGEHRAKTPPTTFVIHVCWVATQKGATVEGEFELHSSRRPDEL